jgi:hypothetical protein
MWGNKAGIEFTPNETGYYVATAKTSNNEWSIRFPVVFREMQFLTWPPLSPSQANLRALSTTVIVNKPMQNSEQIEFWHSRGSKILAGTFVGSRQIDLTKTKEENIQKLVDAWANSGKGTYDGIYLDEIGAYPDEDGMRKTSIMNQALLRYHTQNPSGLIYAAVAGSLLPEQSIGLRNAGATALLEAYEPWLVAAFGTHRYYDYLDERIQTARNTDLIYERGRTSSAIVFLGADGLNGGITKLQLEDAVRHVKKHAPEMPGIAFYSSGKTEKWMQDTKLLPFEEDLCERYYIRPVLEVNGIWIDHHTGLHTGQKTTVQVRVDNLGGMTARHVHLRLYAIPMGTNKRQLIGETTVDRVGVGYTQIIDKSLDGLNYKIEDFGGRQVPIFNIPGYVFRDRAIATFSWTPKIPGPYTLYAVIEPDKQFTLLDGIMTQDISIGS